MHNSNNMWQLVARRLCNEATEEDNNALKKLMDEDPCLQFSMEVLTNFWAGDGERTSNASRQPADDGPERANKEVNDK